MINFPFGTNGKLIILRVPILKHITVDRVSMHNMEVIALLLIVDYSETKRFAVIYKVYP